jgi:hypothetical protein
MHVKKHSLVARLAIRSTPARHGRAARGHSLHERRRDAVDVRHPVQVEFDADRVGEQRRRARMFQPAEISRGQPSAHVDVQAFAVAGDPDSGHDVYRATQSPGRIANAISRARCAPARVPVAKTTADRENRVMSTSRGWGLVAGCRAASSSREAWSA